jgi:hypothetical protein
LQLNRVAAEVLKRGHIPLVGVNAAVPVVEKAGVADKYEAAMMICEALTESRYLATDLHRFHSRIDP